MTAIIAQLANASYICLGLNIISALGLSSEKRAKVKYLVFLLAISLVVQLVAKYLRIKGVNNLALLHAYTLLEFLCISYLYRTIIPDFGSLEKWFRPFLITVAGLIVLNSAFIQPLHTYNSIAKTITQVAYMVYAVLFFFRRMQEDLPAGSKDGLAFINASFLMYYAGSLFIFMFSNVIRALDEQHTVFWMVNVLLYMLFQMLIFIGLWRIRNFD